MKASISPHLWTCHVISQNNLWEEGRGQEEKKAFEVESKDAPLIFLSGLFSVKERCNYTVELCEGSRTG